VAGGKEIDYGKLHSREGERAEEKTILYLRKSTTERTFPEMIIGTHKLPIPEHQQPFQKYGRVKWL